MYLVNKMWFLQNKPQTYEKNRFPFLSFLHEKREPPAVGGSRLVIVTL